MTPSDPNRKMRSPASRRGPAEIGDRVTGRRIPSHEIPLSERHWLLPRYRLRDQQPEPAERPANPGIAQIMREMPLSHTEAEALRAREAA